MRRQACFCAWTSVFVHAQMSSWASPNTSRGPAHEKNPNTFKPERKTDFLDESSLVSVGSFILSLFFFVIIIYSRDVDNAPTQTLQGIIHSACGDVAVPQIVQTTGQSPEPHNSKSYGRKKKKKPCAHHCILILRISPLGTKSILASLTAPDRREPRTSEFTVIISHNPQATASQHVKLFIFSLAAHFLLLWHCNALHVSYSAFIQIICLFWVLYPVFSGNLCVLH